MNLGLKNILALLLMAMSSPTMSQELYEVVGFEIFGVSLGDEADKVVAGLTDYFYIDESDLVINTNPSGQAVDSIEYHSDEIEFRAYLEPKHAPDTRVQTANPHMLVKLQVGWDAGDLDPVDAYFAFTDELAIKFGAPSFFGFGRSDWCEKVKPPGYCDLHVDILSIFHQSDKLGAVLAKDWTP